MSLSGTIKYSKSPVHSYETEAFAGDPKMLYTRLKQILMMYPTSKQVFFFFHTEDNILSCVVDGKKLTWFAKAIVPSTLGIASFAGTYRVRNNKYSMTIVIGSTLDLE